MINYKNLLILFISTFFFSSTFSQLRIEIKGGVEDPINIAIVPMKWELESPQAIYIHKIIESDLEFFGEFSVLSPERMLSLPTSKDEVFYKDWRLLGVDYLVIGQIKNTEINAEVIVSYILFDIAREKYIHRGDVIGPVQSLRKAGHKISDVIYKKYRVSQEYFLLSLLILTNHHKSILIITLGFQI